MLTFTCKQTGKPVYINASTIAAFTVAADGVSTLIYLTSGLERLVAETLAQVCAKTGAN